MKDREMWMDKLKKLENYKAIHLSVAEQLEELVPPVKNTSLSQMGEQQRPQCYWWWPLL